MKKSLPVLIRKFAAPLLLIFFLAFDSYSQVLHQQLRKKSITKSKSREIQKVNSGRASGSSGVVRCSSMEADADLRTKFPSLPAPAAIENQLQRLIGEYKRELRHSRTQATVYTIPVIVHVVHNGQAVGSGPNITVAQVKSQIEVLNEDFRRKSGTPGFNTHPAGADVEVEFVLALRDPQGRTLSEAGIHRFNGGRPSWDTMGDIENVLKPKTQWDPTRYLNIWTVKYGGEMDDHLGYAQFPVLSGLPGLDDKSGVLAKTDGVVMKYTAFGRTGKVEEPFDKGRTTTHEIGHWLGLRHIWGDEQDCEGTDYCSDTPTTAFPNYGCKKGANSCSGEGDDMVENYMDYSDDACMHIFTLEQKNRIRTVLEKSPRRKELLSSTVHLPDNSGKPYAAFSVSQPKVCAGSDISFKDESSNHPTSWKWYILNADSTIVASSRKQNPSFTLLEGGIYGVVLIVSNAKGENRIDKPNYLSVLSGAGVPLPFSENFEGTVVLKDWSVYNPDNDREWVLNGDIGAGNVGSSSIYFDNYTEETDPTGTEDALITPSLNLTHFNDAELSFDVAYAMYEDEEDIYTDTLIVYYSLDCGKTYKPLWKKGGKDLASAASTADFFEPTTSEWKRENISLAFLNGQSNVNLAITNKSGWGNNVYLDNLFITAVIPVTAPIASFTTSTTKICKGDAIQFNDNSSNTPIAWNWSFPGGTPDHSIEQNPTVVYETPGVYAVSLTASNEKGLTTKSEDNFITAYPKPSLSFTASKESICDADSVVLTASGAQEYIWKDGVRGGELGVGASITVRPSISNIYVVEGKNESGCIATSSYEIAFNDSFPKPVISISQEGSGFLLTSSIPEGNQWLLNNEPIPGATAQTLNVLTSGYYSVMVGGDDCSMASEPVSITGDEEEPRLAKLLTVYPIPANAKVFVRYAGANSTKAPKVILYNSLGLALDQQKLQWEGAGWKAGFDVNHYSRGTYFFKLESEGKTVRKTFIKI